MTGPHDSDHGYGPPPQQPPHRPTERLPPQQPPSQQQPQPPQQPEPHGHDDPGAGGQPGPDSQTGPAPDAPETVREAWLFWLIAAALALIGAVVNAFTTSLPDLPGDVRSQLESTVEQTTTDGGEPFVSAEAALQMTMALAAFFALILAAVTVWLAYRMRAGKLWARVTLDIAGILLLVFAVTAVIDVMRGDVSPATSSSPALTFISIAGTVLAGLCAGVAMWRNRSEEARDFYLRGNRGRRD